MIRDGILLLVDDDVVECGREQYNMDKMEFPMVASLSRLFVRFCAKRGRRGEARRREFWRVYCDLDMTLQIE